MTTRLMTRSPSLWPLYAKAAAPSLPGARLVPGLRSKESSELPDLTLELRKVDIDGSTLAEYRRVCGFPASDVVPATYPHLLAFPLHLTLMTDPGFPFPPMGLVHIGNRIEQRRQVRPEDVLDITVAAADLRSHPRGQQVTVVSEARVGDETVWRDETALLRRGESDGEVAAEEGSLPPEAPPGPSVWELGGGLGRAYAAVSGDRNPIHLYDVTAKPFGFSKHIAHGMWTKARALAALQNRLPGSFAVEVAFRKPIYLPNSVCFGARDTGDQIDFGVTSLDGATTHLLGRVTRT